MAIVVGASARHAGAGDEEQPEKAPTAVRFRCVLPDDVEPGGRLSAWWREVDRKGDRRREATWQEGHVVVEVPPGRGLVTVHVAGCVVVGRYVKAQAEAVTDAGALKLVRCTILRGRIVDAEGTPVDDAYVWPRAGDLAVPLEGTDEDGTFSFDGLPDGEVRLRVESDRFVRQTVVVRNGPDEEPVEIVLARGGELKGRVIDENEQPVTDGYVWVLDPHDEENRDRMAWPDVEADGTFAVRLAPGRYRVGATSKRRRGSTIVAVQDGETTEVTILVRR